MREFNSDVVVLGGGAAGLAAAGELARQGFRVALIEARSRLGGRILTVRPRGWGRAVELGAEFIHEGNPDLWRVVRKRLRTRRIPPSHWLFDGQRLERIDDVARRIGRVTALIDKKRVGAQSFARFMQRQRGKISADDRAIAAGFIEGFEAAPMNEMSARAVAGATLNDEKQFVLPDGYDGVIGLLTKALRKARVKIFSGEEVVVVEWREGMVRIHTHGKRGLSCMATAAVIALPLGVLQARPPRRGAVRFSPRLAAKEKLLAKMRVGHVMRVVMRFDTKKWRQLVPKNLRRETLGRFGFIHSRIAGVPVWWSLHDDAIVTGWAGGPAALALVGHAEREVLDRALASLGRIFGVSKAALRAALRDWRRHDWSGDPYSRGAYSFTVAGLDDAPKRLREPVRNTLFFAGEATADAEEAGTVHGALASGLRAAKEVTSQLRRRPAAR